MPRYLVTERRAYVSKYLIDAADEDAARAGGGYFVDEAVEDSYTDDISESSDTSSTPRKIAWDAR